jgi:hypothetical protein
VARVWLRRAFWKNFGQNLDEAWRTWPEQEFHDALSVLNAEAATSKSGSGGSASIPSETTQANFDALPRQPRETPPEPES